MLGMGGQPEAYMLGMGDRLSEQHPDVIVVQGVDDVPTLAFTDDQAQMPEHAKLLGHGGLLHLYVGGQLANRARPGAEPAEDANPARGCERRHRLGDRSGSLAVQIRERRVITVAHAHIIA